MMKKILLWIIRFYQKYISSLKRYPTCRYIPCCSEYAFLAIEKYGVIKGVFKAVYRLLRCNPFSKGGVDFP